MGHDARTTEARARELIAAVAEELLSYGIAVEVPWVRPWPRPGFFNTRIMGDLVSIRLPAPCDRLVGMIGHHAGDVLWSLLLPEVLGGVDRHTHTRGFVVASSPFRLFVTPTDAAVHEFYHLLGCKHALSMSSCYAQIARTKSYYRAADDFFPGISEDGAPVRSRAESDERLRRAVLDGS